MIRAELLAKNISIPALVEKIGAAVQLGAQLHMDSRALRMGDVFVACPGVVGDARAFVDAAIQAGAAAIVAHVENAKE
jgi:UDP-N-acetylmuramyl tripeptide synthase